MNSDSKLGSSKDSDYDNGEVESWVDCGKVTDLITDYPQLHTFMHV